MLYTLVITAIVVSGQQKLRIVISYHLQGFKFTAKDVLVHYALGDLVILDLAARFLSYKIYFFIAYLATFILYPRLKSSRYTTFSRMCPASVFDVPPSR